MREGQKTLLKKRLSIVGLASSLILSQVLHNWKTNPSSETNARPKFLKSVSDQVAEGARITSASPREGGPAALFAQLQSFWVPLGMLCFANS